jgi:hypothetical protein
LADDDLNKLFVRLSRALAVGSEQAVSIPELKMVVAKTLSVLSQISWCKKLNEVLQAY